jgi:hypothetical protein
MYSWGGGGGGVGQKFPNDEKNFRIFNGIQRHEGVCYPENEDAICKQKYAYIKHKGRTRAEGPRKFLNLESLKCHFLDFGDVLTEFWWSENSVLVRRNLQFAYNLVVLNARRRI